MQLSLIGKFSLISFRLRDTQKPLNTYFFILKAMRKHYFIYTKKAQNKWHEKSPLDKTYIYCIYKFILTMARRTHVAILLQIRFLIKRTIDLGHCDATG